MNMGLKQLLCSLRFTPVHPRSRAHCRPLELREMVRLFKELGLPMLESAWSGYNCSIFAYGQKGSGKSYSIMGHGENKGLVPRMCERLFEDIANKDQDDMSYQVRFSMLEIYNEKIRDLLSKKSKVASGGLKLRETPASGFIVDGLSIRPVRSFDDIRLLIQEGQRQRTIAATKMNATSSRAHTIVEIRLTQNSNKGKVVKQSSIKLVDLAGSERQKQTESEGDRFKESVHINKSLSTLGLVMKALYDQKMHVPYRDSVLTKLLQNALEGNSKTLMVAAISPDAENYEQTLSTLKYADRAKSIKTSAKVNETTTDKKIKEVKNEVQRLEEVLQKDQKYDEDIRRLLQDYEAEIQSYKDSQAAWERLLEDNDKYMEEFKEREQVEEAEEKKLPHFSNLNEDPALTGKLIHIIREDRVRVGNGKDGSRPEIILHGPRIAKEHAEVLSRKHKLHLRPLKGLVLHNGRQLTETDEVKLVHNDRIRFGSNNLFVFLNPEKAKKLQKKGKTLIDVTYEYAQNEIAEKAGLNIEQDDMLLQEEVTSVMQLVDDANAMAEDMGKHVSFNIELVSPEALGLESTRTKIDSDNVLVYVKVYVRQCDESNGNKYMWSHSTFLNRQSDMQEIYQQFEGDGNIPQIDKETDPFWEPADTPVMVGVASVPLMFLSHLLKLDREHYYVYNYCAEHIGFIDMNIVPCNSAGQEDGNLYVKDPIDMLKEESGLNFKVKIFKSQLGLDMRYKKIWCRYKFYNEDNYTKTHRMPKTNCQYNHEKTHHIENVDDKFVNYLLEKCLWVEVWGQQFDNAANAGRHRREDIPNLQAKLDDLHEKVGQIEAVVSENPENAELVMIKRILDS